MGDIMVPRSTLPTSTTAGKFGINRKDKVVKDLQSAVNGLLNARDFIDEPFFTDQDSFGWGCNEQQGIIASLQGIKSILSTLVIDEFTIKQAHKESIIQEWKGILDDLKDMHKRPILDAEPYKDMAIDLNPSSDEKGPHYYLSAVYMSFRPVLF